MLCCACTGRDLNNDAVLLDEVKIADGGIIMVNVSPGQNTYSDPPPDVQAASDAASPALLLTQRVTVLCCCSRGNCGASAY